LCTEGDALIPCVCVDQGPDCNGPICRCDDRGCDADFGYAFRATFAIDGDAMIGGWGGGDAWSGMLRRSTP
jgi:hypothetical protein